MCRSYFIMASFLLYLALQGCTTVEKLDGSTEEELEKFRMSRNRMWNEVVALRSENEYLKNQLNAQGEETRRAEELEIQVEGLKRENERLRHDKAELMENLAALELKENELEEKISQLEMETRGGRGNLTELPREEVKDIERLKIKVLSGDGDIASAESMADRLKSMGYRIGRIDLAPKASFSQHTVYYADGIEKEAEDLVAHIDENTVARPLTWPSQFDLIVVTGKKR